MLGKPPRKRSLEKNMIQHDPTMYTKQHACKSSNIHLELESRVQMGMHWNGRCHCTLQHHVVAQEAQMRCIHLHPSNRTTHLFKIQQIYIPSGTTHLANIIHPHTSTYIHQNPSLWIFIEFYRYVFHGFLSIYRCFSPMKKMGSPRWHRLLP